MKNKFKNRLRRLRIVAIYLLLNMVFNLAFPTVSMALTAGPGAPEFSSFEPVATTDMVDPFSGNFTYNLPVLNIPGADGGGYAMSLSYHSGVTSEEEASWVGLGWTLNAGAINRSKVGFADEFNGVTVHRYNKTTPLWTSSVTIDGALEYSSKDKEKKPLENAGNPKPEGEAEFQFEFLSEVDVENLEEFQMVAKGTASLRYNNYQGFTRTNGYSSSYKGMASLNLSRSGGQSTFGFSVNPLAILFNYKAQKAKEAWEKIKKETPTTDVEIIEQKWNKAVLDVGMTKFATIFKYSNITLSPSNINTMPGFSVARTIAESRNFSSSVEVNSLGPIGIELGYSGNHNYQVSIPLSDMKAYGYMHNPNWSDYFDDASGEVEDPFNEYETATDDDDSKIIADYFIEHESSFNKHDKYLGVPFNGADQFIVTGEGIIGGFRMHQDQIGTYYPTPVTNKQKIKQLGVEFGVGQTLQVGLDLGIGYQRTVVGNWKEKHRENINTNYEFKTTAFARFNNDMGGSLRYTETDDLYSAYFDSGKDLEVTDSLELIGSLPFEHGRSSTIIYSVYDDEGDISWDYHDVNSNSTHPGALDKLQSTADLRDIKPEGGIAEILTIGADGSRYLYGLPVYARNEGNLTYAVTHPMTGAIMRDNSSYATDEPSTVNMTVFNDPLSNKMAIGDVIEEAYATAHLITQITSPNYVDINDNGPDGRDFGGWTKFAYRKKHGGAETPIPGEEDFNWYHHRAPYNGLFYNKGKINDFYDQTASVSRGAKEVCFLKAVETKTHIAFFVTNEVGGTDFDDQVNALTTNEAIRTKIKSYLNGSGDLRYDALGAIDPEKGNHLDLASDEDNLPSLIGSHPVKRMEKLERIVLFSKDRLELPLTTTNFEYSYELCRGVPNNQFSSSEPGDLNYANSGKLTLKKVWTETEGVVRSKIAPYQFEYNYFDDYQSTIAARYPEIAAQYAGLIENPQYQFDLLDPWGNYQHPEVSKAQRNKLRTWMSQAFTYEDFDPAAWHLKRVILPSGGEIHVQYEQKDYTHVQDKAAMHMVSLDPDESLHENEIKYDENKYFINLEDLNAVGYEDAYFNQLIHHYFTIDVAAENDVVSDDVVNIEENGVTRHAENGQVYFQFLYSYWQEYYAATYPLETDDDRGFSEFIDGYSAVYEIGKTADGIYFGFGDNKKNKFNVPRRLCRENLLTMGGQGLSHNEDIGIDFASVNANMLSQAYTDPLPDDGDQEEEEAALDLIKNELKDQDVASKLFFKGLLGFKVSNPGKKNGAVCANLDPKRSYLRLPVFHAKKGGGIRVKRLLTYNHGIENGEESLYGTEYIYKMEDGTSSGVATFEPAGNRVENPMVDIQPRLKQTLYNKLLSGRDKKYQEGPLGESLYPSPSVGHRRVIMKNIHSGKSAPGFVVNNYLTCKDHPSIQMISTEIHGKRANKETAHYRKSKINIPLGLFNYQKDNAWVTQGYLFKINDLHGKLASTLTYGGTIDSEDPRINPLYNSLLASVTNEYSGMDDVHKSIRMNNEQQFVLDENYRPGEEEDVVLYMGRVEDRTNDFSIELDLNITLCVPPIFSVGIMPQVNMQETELSQHVTCRIIRRNSMLEKVTTYAEGMESTTEYLAYDPYTGNPVLTKTIDQYEGSGTKSLDKDRRYTDAINEEDHAYYSLSIPASWIYPEMGQKSGNLNNLNLLNATAGSVVTYMSNPLEKFVGGVWDPYVDEIDQVIAASAMEFRKDRFADTYADITGGEMINSTGLKTEYDATVGVNGFTSAHLNAMNKFYYPVSTYSFIGQVVSANTATSYEGGIINGFSFFNWDPSLTPALENAAAGWKYASQITKYSPHGHPLEEINILGIPSAVRFGYGKLLPVMVAGNAEYETIAFEDFETTNLLVTDEAAHTGKKSRLFNGGGTTTVLENMVLTERLYTKGGHFKIWLKSKITGAENTTIPSVNLSGMTYPLAKVARVGDWTLYQVYIHNWGSLSIGTALTATLNYALQGDEKLYIDDVCFNPMEGAVNCTVYDPASFRVVAQFSDQHFATIYEYNLEGQLVRTVIETERGRKTVTEQQYNLPRTVAND